MGKTKTKIIDDSLPTDEVKEQKPKREKILAINRAEEAKPERKKVLDANLDRDKKFTGVVKSEPVKAGGAVELSKQSEVEEKLGAKQTPSKPSGRASGALRPDKRPQPKHSKQYQEAQEKVDKGKNYPIDEAAELVKTISYTKFDGTLEIHINTAVKGIRGLINLPFASGKKLNIIAFGKGAEESGADIIGDDEQLAEIMKGEVNFDAIVTTPDWMPKLARAAKTLGPKGLMPNPKNGTITTDLKKTVAELQGGKTEYKTEAKANVIHLGIGKISQPKEELTQNIKLLLSTIGKSKIKKAVISPTMGPGIKLDLSSI